MPVPDNTSDDSNQDDKGTQAGPPPSLDQIHAINQAKMEAEDDAANNGAENDDDGADESDDGAGDGDKGDGGESDDGAKGGDDNNGSGEADEDQDDGDDSDIPPAKTADEPPAKPTVTPEPTVELNLDINKDAPGKVAIRDSEGNKLYFNNLDEIPDTFEPLSYKELMKGASALIEKAGEDARKIVETQEAAEAEERTAATKALEESWEADATKLTEAGLLPKGKENESAKEEVYKYIEDEMKKGNVITSFSQAYKGMKYDQQVVADAQKQKDLDDAKKKRGGMVQGGSGAGGDSAPTNPRGGGRILEAPPSGVSLDAVHARAISKL